MKFVFAFLLVLCFVGLITCPPHHSATGILCYHCGGRHGKYPECLTEKHQCSEHEYCHMSDKDGHLKSDCWSIKDCGDSHIRHCMLSKSLLLGRTCETCCKTEDCVHSQIASFKGIHPTTTVKTSPMQTTTKATTTTTTPPPPTTTTTTTTPTTTTAQTTMTTLITSTKSISMANLIAGECKDRIELDGCKNIPTVCKDSTGVSFCPETCGLCTVLASRFHANMTCHDQLFNNECQTSISPEFCKSDLAKITCPKSCNLCETIINALIQTIVTGAQTTVTQTIPTTTFTTDAVCHDELPNCNTLDGVCTNPLASQICRSTCKLCDDMTTSQQVPNIAVTVTQIKHSTSTDAPTTQRPSTTSLPSTAVNVKTSEMTTDASSNTSNVHKCYQCGDIKTDTYCEGIDLIMPPLKPCPNHSPYCVTDLKLDATGPPSFIKRCANHAQCVKDWWEKTSGAPICLESDPTQVSVTKTCTYCCTGDGCNNGDVPLKATLFKP